jgi:histidine triad (HIT) family protein
MAKVGDFDFYCEQALTGKTQIQKLYESDKVLAFYHTKPSYKIHIMIIPKEHIHDLLHLKNKHNDLIIELYSVVKKLSKDLDIENDGARLITNMGKFQETPHLHFHLISGEKIN